MKKRTRLLCLTAFVVIAAIGSVIVHSIAGAHCDTLDGPVVTDAKLALAKGDVTPVLKWVQPDDEAEIKAAFRKALAVRDKGPEARDLADTYFFETLVRVHRAREGAPYTGLKPAGGEVEPGIAAADRSLVSGDADHLVEVITKDVAEGIRTRHARTVEAKKHADDSVEAGRKYVESYVEFIHYVERIHADAVGQSAHADETEPEGAHSH